MSLPEFPKNNPPLSREEVINQIISSIAMEELGMSHIINAEGEKIQYALGTIPGVDGPEKPLTIEDLLKLNDSVHKTLDSSMMNQVFLREKLNSALSATVMQGPTGPVGTILDSFDTIDELRSAHPTGSQGDAYLVKGDLYTWDSENQAWKMVGKLTGPQGLQGPAGPISTILDSFPSYQELVAAHPAGNVGDVYIAGDELYTWVADEKRWMSLGSLIGPEGPKGATGSVGVILNSYTDYQALVAAHPSGNQGDAFLVGQGDLWVWKENATSWEKVGNLRGQDGPQGPQGLIGPQGIPGPEGPEGPQGKAGTSGTIRETFPDVAALEAAYPDGSGVEDGDLFLVGVPGAFDLYFWNGTDWVNAGPFTGVQGQEGPQGPRGADSRILGSYASYDILKAAHPTGNIGESYLINGELYTWLDNGSGFDWRPVGSLKGPVGPVGTILGSYDTFEDLYADHQTGNQGDAYLVDGTLYVWDPENNKWKRTGNLRGPAAESYMIIPFASTEAPLTYSNNGAPSKVSLIGFGYGDRRDAGLLSAADYSIPLDPSNQKFNLSGNGNKQLVFSLPVNVVLKSIHITVGNYGRFTPTGEVFPYVQLYSADPGSNTFSPIPGAFAVPSQGIGPGANIAADTMRFASVEGINVKLKAGTRIGIGGLMRINNDSSSGEKKYWLYFTGGIAMVYDPEG